MGGFGFDGFGRFDGRNKFGLGFFGPGFDGFDGRCGFDGFRNRFKEKFIKIKIIERFGRPGFDGWW